ncbi:hypothetical protein [Longimycelium tulufanense]|nr:hypothetical protein [Longimycelium tulufanense]
MDDHDRPIAGDQLDPAVALNEWSRRADADRMLCPAPRHGPMVALRDRNYPGVRVTLLNSDMIDCHQDDIWLVLTLK